MKGSAYMVAGNVLARAAHATLGGAPAGDVVRTNWSGNYTYKAAHLDQPANVEELKKLVTSSPHTKTLGARHSFNGIADTAGDQISLKQFDRMTLDRQAHTVTLGAGLTYGKLAPWLDAQGFAVHNLASLPHVTVAGACCTATHGSGIHNGNLSTAVTAIEFVSSDGHVRTLSRMDNPQEFEGAVVGLGALGIITNITLKVIPAFQIAQVVYQNLSFDELEHNLDNIFSSGYSVSLFTDWQNHRATQVWLKQLSSGVANPHLPELFYGATLQKADLHPLPGHSAENCTEQMGIPGPWYERLPHFRMNFTPSSGAELQTEYFVPRGQAYQAILAVETLRDQIAPHLFVSEMRTIAADNLWLSMAYQRDSLAFHFTWKPDTNAVLPVLSLIEGKLRPFQARPHWAKLHTVPPQQLRQLYPQYHAFQKLRARMDPEGRFQNEYLRRVFSA